MGNGTAFRPRNAELGSRPPLDPRAILTSIGEVVYDWDMASDAISWGVNAPDVLGLPDLAPLSTGRGLAYAVEPSSGRSRHDAIHHDGGRDEGNGAPYRTRYALRLRPDRVVMVEDAGRWFAGADGQPIFAHGVLRVQRAMPGEEGVGNGVRDRSNFIGQIVGDVAEAGRSRRPMTLLVAAVDQLGGINDDLGYEAADLLIGTVMDRIRSSLRRQDRLVRYGGNRFAVVLMSCSADQAETAARRLCTAVQGDPIATPDGSVVVRLKIGAAVVPDHAVDAAGLLRRAEDAMGVAKRGYGRAFVMFDPGVTREVSRRLRRVAPLDIVEALNARRIVFARQPIVDARTRAVAFHEALVRAHTPEGRLVSAGELLPSVERSGLVPLVDVRVLELAADHLAAHPAERLSINISPATLEGPDWLSTLAAHLGARPGVAERLIIEIVETAAVGDPEATRARLDAMKALGVGIAIDDFGAGHTSFKHLRSFPVDMLKIDGAFVQNLSRSSDDRFFVRTLVDLAHHLGIATVAEWVEDEETARTLAEWGVDYLQGTHCGAPVLLGADGLPSGTSAVA